MKRKILAITLAAIMATASCSTAFASESSASSAPAEEAAAQSEADKKDESDKKDDSDKKGDPVTAAIEMILTGVNKSLSSVDINFGDILTGLMSNIDPAALVGDLSLDSITDTLTGNVDQIGSTVTGLVSGLGDAVGGVVSAVGSGDGVFSGILSAVVPFFTDSGALELLLGQYIGPEGIVTKVLDIIAGSKGDLANIVSSLKSKTGGYDVAKFVEKLGTTELISDEALSIDGVELTSDDVADAVSGAIEELGVSAIQGE